MDIKQNSELESRGKTENRETYRMLDGWVEKKHDGKSIKVRGCHGKEPVEA